MFDVAYRERLGPKRCVLPDLPLGFCGAPFHNDGVEAHRIQKVKEWIPHLEKLGIGAVYFSPVFESDSHGYDTRDYRLADRRLGTNEASAISRDSA